ncbi:MAG TPA: phytanoyl-CoA dioxygenase family protein [Cytophagales bacterium]
MQDVLHPSQIEQFIREGFVRLDGAFPAQLAGEARRILWKDTGCDPDDPATWTQPVIRLGMYAQPPFVAAANTPVLHRAFDQLVGPGRWLPCQSMGTFPVRFPAAGEPGDTGWHVDASFPGADPANYFDWRINVRSKGRALLMLFLFSDVSERDAPTRIRAGSHLDVARVLEPAGEPGLSFTELAGRLDGLPPREEVLATGAAGTVYLCHPFVAHAAQPHRGSQPRFLAQPPLLPRGDWLPGGPPAGDTPVAAAIRAALAQPG